MWVRDQKNDLLAHEWTSLRGLWEQCRDAITDEKHKQELESLAGKESAGWDAHNRAEQIIGMYLEPLQLKVEYDNLLRLAREQRIPSLKDFENYKDRLFDNPTCANACDLEKEQRAVYQALLFTLQSEFAEARFERKLKRKTAIGLLLFGSCLLAVAIVVHLIKQSAGQTRCAEALLVGAVVGMGVLGAFFSRVTAFQADFSNLGFIDITNNYRAYVLCVRLLCGAIGAMVTYHLLRSGLVSGPMLPDWCALNPADGSNCGPDSAGKPPKPPMGEWSKLLVWSFLAGFSERLVKKSLDKFSAE